MLQMTGLVCAANAGGPLLGVSGIEIPGRFLELRDVDSDGIDDVVFMRRSDSTTIEAMGYMPGQPGFGFGEPLIVEGLDIGYSFDPEATVGILDQTGLPTVVVIDNHELRGYQSVNGQAVLVFEERFIPGDPPGGFLTLQELKAGDLDADGLTDLLLLRENSFVIRWGGRQPFTRYQQFLTPGAFVILPVQDYNADGFDDVLIVMEGTGELVAYPGGPIDKLGSPVATGVLVRTDFGFDPQELDLGMGNFDTNPAADLVYSDGVGSAVFHLNFMTTARETRLIPQAGREDSEFIMVAGDWDGDGLDDLRVNVSEPTSTFHRYPMTAGLWTDVLGSTPDLVEFWGHAVFPLGFPSAVRCADTDEDGVREIITFAEDVSVLYGKACSRGLPDFGPSAGPARNTHLHTLAIDLNADGTPELFHTGGTATATDPNRLAEPLYEFPDFFSRFMSVPYEIDDGVVRIAVGGNPLRIITFGPGGQPAVDAYPGPAIGSTTGLCTGDFNGDGVQDVGIVTDDTFQVFRGLGDGSVEWFAEVAAPAATKPAAVDLNDDGISDLVMGNSDTDSIVVLRNLGGGEFAQVDTWAATANYWIEAGDFDGDGLTDLVGVNGSFGNRFDEVSAAVWYGLPNGGFSEEVAIHARGLLLEVVIADLDDDGLQDFVFGSTHTNGPTGWETPDDGTLIYRQSEPRSYEFVGRLPGWSSVGVAAGDFNGDGSADVATVLNDARRTFIHWGTPVPCPADLNCDGSADFFDLAAYVASFQSQSSDADLAEPFGVWNFFDMAAFIQVFNAGCP
jgi:hypothetical protein